MVFEYADRNNLRIFLKSLKLDLMIRVKLSLDIAKGLSYLHQLKIIHRDLVSHYFKKFFFFVIVVSNFFFLFSYKA